MVTQADRERAAEFFRSDACPLSVKMTLGYDPSPLILAFAAHREAHTAGLVEALEAINRLTSPGNRTFDAMMTDMGLACDIARAVLEAHAK